MENKQRWHFCGVLTGLKTQGAYLFILETETQMAGRKW